MEILDDSGLRQVLTTLAGRETALRTGYNPDMRVGSADDLEGDIGRVSTTWQPIVRTTGGSLDLKSDEPVYLRNIVGACDPDTGLGLKLTGIRFNGFNALIPTQKITGTIGGSTVAATGTNQIAYFKCVKGTWGTYGVSDENNGYLFTDNSGSKVVPINVKTTATVPASGVALTTVPTQSYGGYKYYLPATTGHYLCAEFSSSVNLNNICAHIAWSNKDDDRFETRSAAEINLSTVVSSFPNGLLGIDNGTSFIADEINFNDAQTSCTLHRRLHRIASMGSVTWSLSGQETSEESTTYTYSATLPSASVLEPAYLSGYGGSAGILYWDGSTLKFDTGLSTVTAVQSELADKFLVYQVATEYTSSKALSGSAICNDMGTEEVLGTDAVAGLGKITTTYVGRIKDYIRGLPAELSNVEKTTAQALTELKVEVEGLKAVVGSLSSFLFTEKVDGEQIFTEGSGSPDWIPAMPWQLYRDRGLAVPAIWIATGNTAANQWVKITE